MSSIIKVGQTWKVKIGLGEPKVRFGAKIASISEKLVGINWGAESGEILYSLDCVQFVEMTRGPVCGCARCVGENTQTELESVKAQLKSASTWNTDLQKLVAEGNEKIKKLESINNHYLHKLQTINALVAVFRT